MSNCGRSLPKCPYHLHPCVWTAVTPLRGWSRGENCVTLPGTKLQPSLGLSNLCPSHLLSSSVLCSHVHSQSRPPPCAPPCTCSPPQLPGCHVSSRGSSHHQGRVGGSVSVLLQWGSGGEPGARQLGGPWQSQVRDAWLGLYSLTLQLFQFVLDTRQILLQLTVLSRPWTLPI